MGPIMEKIPDDQSTTWLSNLVVTPKKLKPGQHITDMEARPSVDEVFEQSDPYNEVPYPKHIGGLP